MLTFLSHVINTCKQRYILHFIIEMFNKITKFISINPFVGRKSQFLRQFTRFKSIESRGNNNNNKTFDNNCDYLDSNNVEAFNSIKKSMKVLNDFVSEEEEESLIKEIEPYIKRLRYESSHWDDAIHNYRETERLKWTDDNQIIIDRVRQTAFPAGVAPIRTVHILDLAKDGVIKAHIDAVRVSLTRVKLRQFSI